jgi:hypothetical protein
LRLGNHLVGISAISDAVAKIDHQVVSGSRSQTGIQRFQIAVNVAENENTHKLRIIVVSAPKARTGG